MRLFLNITSAHRLVTLGVGLLVFLWSATGFAPGSGDETITIERSETEHLLDQPTTTDQPLELIVSQVAVSQDWQPRNRSLAVTADGSRFVSLSWTGFVAGRCEPAQPVVLDVPKLQDENNNEVYAFAVNCYESTLNLSDPNYYSPITIESYQGRPGAPGENGTAISCPSSSQMLITLRKRTGATVSSSPYNAIQTFFANQCPGAGSTNPVERKVYVKAPVSAFEIVGYSDDPGVGPLTVPMTLNMLRNPENAALTHLFVVVK